MCIRYVRRGRERGGQEGGRKGKEGGREGEKEGRERRGKGGRDYIAFFFLGVL